ncbi:MAG: hypothetical protein H6739_07040 [Alphaproteobacteria bacterium]|nr:hypothetical protein [Alphaproteobacteria bacterium]
MRKIILASFALALGTACKDSTTCDSGDSGCAATDDTFTGGDDTADCTDCALDLTAVNWNCDATGYWYDAYMVGWQYGTELYIYQTGSTQPWYEYGHEFPASTPWSGATAQEIADGDTRGYYSDYGYWDNPYMFLSDVDSTSAVVLGSTTLYECEEAGRNDTLTWSVVVYDENGAEADCASWGDDPSANEEGYNFGRCDVF